MASNLLGTSEILEVWADTFDASRGIGASRLEDSPDPATSQHFPVHAEPPGKPRGFLWVRFDLNSPFDADYALRVEYASGEARPCRVMWYPEQGKPYSVNVFGHGTALGAVTAGWHVYQEEVVGILHARANGHNALIIARGEGTFGDGWDNGNLGYKDFPFPHIRRLLIQKV